MILRALLVFGTFLLIAAVLVDKPLPIGGPQVASEKPSVTTQKIKQELVNVQINVNVPK